MGLLLSHICTLRIFPDMVKISHANQEPPQGGGAREAITDFTPSSRKRLLEFMHTLQFNSAVFVTLTYPAIYPHVWKAYKAHLRAFRARVERRWGAIKAVWRLEYQKRGAPHYHIIYLDAPYMDIRELSVMWYEIVKSGDENHLKNGVDLKPVSDWGDRGLVAHYVAKYTSKVVEEVSEDDRKQTGRHWGKWNLKEENPIEIQLDAGQAEYFAIMLFASRGRADTWRPSDYTRATIMGDDLGRDTFRSRALSYIREIARK